MLRSSALIIVLLFASTAAAADALSYEQHVRPILKAYCFECHGDGDKLRGELDLRLRRLIVQGGESGPAVVSGKPADSRLLQKVQSGDMPPSKRKKLSADEVARIAHWIADGAQGIGP